MADKELPWIPELAHSRYTYSFDYGGSVIKILYKKKNERGEDRLYLRSISGGQNDELLKFLTSLGDPGTERLIVTGVGSMANKDVIEKTLNVKLELRAEFDCFYHGFHALAKHLPYDVMFEAVDHDVLMSTANIVRACVHLMDNFKEFTIQAETPELTPFSSELLSLSDQQAVDRYFRHDVTPATMFPCIVIMYSSALACFKLMGPGQKGQMCGFNPRAGSTLMGLGSLLAGVKSYDELLGLAERGDNAKVDAYVSSVRGDKNKGGDPSKASGDQKKEAMYGEIPGDVLVFALGQAVGKSPSDFRREDLAAAVVQLMCDEGALFALQMAHTHRVRDVIICGSFFNHPLTWKRLSASFLQDSLGLPDAVQPRIHLCKLGTYVGAIGCFCADALQETAPAGNSET